MAHASPPDPIIDGSIGGFEGSLTTSVASGLMEPFIVVVSGSDKRKAFRKSAFSSGLNSTMERRTVAVGFDEEGNGEKDEEGALVVAVTALIKEGSVVG